MYKPSTFDSSTGEWRQVLHVRITSACAHKHLKLFKPPKDLLLFSYIYRPVDTPILESVSNETINREGMQQQVSYDQSHSNKQEINNMVLLTVIHSKYLETEKIALHSHHKI